MYELSGVYDYAGQNVYGSSFGALPPINETIATAVKGTVEEARRRALEQIGTQPTTQLVPATASTDGASKYVMLAAAAAAVWFLFIRKK